MSNMGIYVVRNTRNGKAYVGSSVDVLRRWRDHKKRLRDGIHDNAHLQRAWNVYGESTFEFKIIETVSVSGDLLIAECKWIAHFNSNDQAKGYNTRIDPSDNRGLHYHIGQANGRSRLTAEQVIEIRKRLLAGGRQINIAAEFGVADKTINSIRIGQSWKHVAELRDAVIALPRSGGTRNNRGVNNPRARLTEEDVAAIRGLLASGAKSQAEIGRQFEIDGQTVWRIKHGVQWSNA